MENIAQRVNHYKLGVGKRFPRLRKHRIGAHFGDARVLSAEGPLAGVPLSEIIDAACRACNISKDHFMGPRRARIYSWPRQIVMHIAREKCPHLSLPSIGRLMGGRDHTTVIHGIKACQIRMEDDPDFRETYNRVLREAGFL